MPVYYTKTIQSGKGKGKDMKDTAKKIKKVAGYLANASYEDRQGLQKVMQFYGSASTEEHEALLHFVLTGEDKESIVSIADELDEDLQFIGQVANVLSTAEGMGIEQASSIFSDIMERADRAKANANKLFELAKRSGIK